MLADAGERETASGRSICGTDKDHGVLKQGFETFRTEASANPGPAPG